jgi:major type 1 subunit fimbrin (pilin)
MKVTIAIRLFLAALAGCAIAPSVHARCGFIAASPTTSSTMALQITNLTVPRDMPVGTSIYIQEFHQAHPGTRFQCDGLELAVENRYRVVGVGRVTNVNVGEYAGKIYETGVPGIGVAWFAGQVGARAIGDTFVNAPPDPAGCNRTQGLTVPAGRCLTGLMKFFNRSAMVLVKTGPVGVGTISAASLGRLTLNAHIDGSTYSVTSVGLSGSINVVGTTCKTSDVSVPMGRHKIASLTGLNSATPKVGFTIALTDCPGFPGYFGSISSGAIPASSENAVINAGTPIKNGISIRLDAVGSAIDASKGLLSIAPGDGFLAARGVGVQLLDSAGLPVALSRNLPQNMVLDADTKSLNISLGARYLQTAETVTPGQANAMATYTIIYQ